MPRRFFPFFRLIKRSLWAAVLLIPAAGRPAVDAPGVAPAAAPAVTVPPLAPLVVWEAPVTHFTDAEYAEAVEQLLQDFETRTGHKLVPGKKKKVGLKIYSDSGPGLATPFGLVKGVIASLERRGFAPENIFLVGLNQLRLRLTGFLPSLVTGQSPFQGHPIYVLESGRYYDPTWFYDSPLPSRFDPILTEAKLVSTTTAPSRSNSLEEDRKSFLATPLFLDADFWINLPVYTDHPVLGVNGALVNATLWNASNTLRFFRSPATAPAAVAEMAAIPELRQGWVLNIASLERYQFIGGPYFNSLYTASEPRIWMSTDPVLLDALMLQKIDWWRKRAGFEPVDEDDIRLLSNAQQLGVGTEDPQQTKWVKLGGK